MKILVIRFSSIGDIVLTSPVIRCLKKQMPAGTEIHFITKPNFAFLLNQNPYLDKLLILKPALNETIAEIKYEKYDLIIDLHNNLRTLLIKITTGVKSFSFNKLNFQKFILTQFKINQLPHVHIVERYFKTVEKIGVSNDNEGLDYYNPASKTELISKFDALSNQPFVALAIGGQHFTKRMPPDKLLKIIKATHIKIVIIGGLEDVGIGNLLDNNLPHKLINLTGRLSVHQSAGIIALSKGLLTNDTGMMHIAAALKKPVIAIWGNTILEFGMYAYYGKEKIYFKNFEVTGLNCRPCSKLGFDSCPRGHFNCMNLQDTNQIALAINSLV